VSATLPGQPHAPRDLAALNGASPWPALPPLAWVSNDRGLSPIREALDQLEHLRRLDAEQRG